MERLITEKVEKNVNMKEEGREQQRGPHPLLRAIIYMKTEKVRITVQILDAGHLRTGAQTKAR